MPNRLAFRAANLRRVGGALEPGLVSIEPSQETRIIRVEHEDAHSFLDRNPEAVVLVDPRLVGAAGHVAPPGFLVEVPMDGLAESRLETHAASAAEFGREFCGVDRITVVMARPVGHEIDKRAAARP